MAKNGYAQRVALARETYLKIGQDFGAQKMADLVEIALNDPEVMGKALGEIFGDGLDPFAKRYPWLKDVKYGR